MEAKEAKEAWMRSGSSQSPREKTLFEIGALASSQCDAKPA